MRKIIDIINENAEFDARLHPQNDLETFSYREFTNKGRADTKNRPTNPRYGDNAMENQSMLDEDEDSAPSDEQINNLHSALNSAGVSDDEIAAGISLTDEGMQKIASGFSISIEQAHTLLNCVCQNVRSDSEDQKDAVPLDEDETEYSRFSYEQDRAGNFTARDGVSGHERFFSGARGARILAALDNASPAKIQKILKRVMFPVNESTIQKKSGYDDEIMNEAATTFNFIWNIGGKHGTATGSVGDDPEDVRILMAVDSDGKNVEITDDNKEDFVTAARSSWKKI